VQPVTMIMGPRNTLEGAIADSFCAILGLDEIDVRDDFFELGGDSVQAMQLMLLLSTKLGRQVPETLIFEHRTVEALTRHIEAAGAPSIVVAVQPHGEARPFFIVHAHDGRAEFARFGRWMTGVRPVYGFQNRSLWLSGGGFESLDQMVQSYLGEVRRRQPAGPYLLGGYCYGGHVALEMARQLESQGERVVLVAIVDPEPQTGGAWCQLQLVAACLGQIVRHGSARHLAILRRALARRAALTGLRKRLRRDHGAVAIGPDAANVALLRRHAGGVHHGEVVAFCSGYRAYAAPDSFSWRGQVAGPLTFVRLPDCSACLEEPGARSFAAALEEAIARVEAGPAPNAQPTAAADRIPVPATLA
jgi:thioesterase domain-containing protein/acyl carrier protein